MYAWNIFYDFMRDMIFIDNIIKEKIGWKNYSLM